MGWSQSDEKAVKKQIPIMSIVVTAVTYSRQGSSKDKGQGAGCQPVGSRDVTGINSHFLLDTVSPSRLVPLQLPTFNNSPSAVTIE